MERGELHPSTETKVATSVHFSFDGLIRLLVVSGIVGGSFLAADYFISNDIDSLDKLRHQISQNMPVTPIITNG